MLRSRVTPRVFAGRVHGLITGAACLGLVGALTGSLIGANADEFGDHDRPWAADKTQAEMVEHCPALGESLAAGRISGDLSPMPPMTYEAGERALALAADRMVALDAYAEELNTARAQVHAAALAIREEAAALEALRGSVREEITRLEGVEDAANERRVDMLRNVRPKRAAELVADEAPEDIARLLARMAPRESAAIISALPPRLAADVFDAMAPLMAEDTPSAGEADADAPNQAA